MYRWYDCKVPLLFQDLFQYVRNIHLYGTRQFDQVYTPKVKTNHEKCSLRYKGSVVSNSILTAHVNTDTLEAGCVKLYIFVTGLTRSFIMGNLIYQFKKTIASVIIYTCTYRILIYFACAWYVFLKSHICTCLGTCIHVWVYSCIYGLLRSLYMVVFLKKSFSIVTLFELDFVTCVIYSSLLILKHRCTLMKYVNITSATDKEPISPWRFLAPFARHVVFICNLPIQLLVWQIEIRHR